MSLLRFAGWTTAAAILWIVVVARPTTHPNSGSSGSSESRSEPRCTPGSRSTRSATDSDT